MKNPKALLIIGLSLLLLSMWTGQAAGYPQKPITIIVPWAAGGGTDRTARALAAALEPILGVPVGVVNRTGGGGVVGHSALATARPDGYTLGMITIEITMMHWLGITTLTYRDYTPIALIIHNPAGITVRADSPWQTYQELLDYIKQNPGKLKASGTAAGGVWHLALLGWLLGAGIKDPGKAVVWVPSVGAAAALQELMAGGIDFTTNSPLESLPLVEAGQARILAVMADKRLSALPDVPTLKELGVDFTIGGWAGLAAPAGLPEEVLQKLLTAVEQALRSEIFQNFIKTSGFVTDIRLGEAFHDFLALQDTLNARLLKEAGLR